MTKADGLATGSSGDFGLDFCFVPKGPIADIEALALLGEQLGFRNIWIPDQGFFRDPFLLAGAAARVTRRIGIGIGITTTLARHPVHVARAIATLDEMSGSRAILGLGTGNVANVIGPMGLSVDKPLQSVANGLSQVQALLRGESVSFGASDGAEVGLDFVPPRVPPFYIGGRGPRILQFAGRRAQGALLETLISSEAMRYARAELEKGASAAGRELSNDFDHVAWQIVEVTDSPAELLVRYRPWILRLIEAGPRAAVMRAGVAETAYDEIMAALQHSGREAACDLIDGDVVAKFMLVGTGAQVRSRIEELRVLGATSICALQIGEFADAVRNLSALARAMGSSFVSEGSPDNKRRVAEA